MDARLTIERENAPHEPEMVLDMTVALPGAPFRSWTPCSERDVENFFSERGIAVSVKIESDVPCPSRLNGFARRLTITTPRMTARLEPLDSLPIDLMTGPLARIAEAIRA